MRAAVDSADPGLIWIGPRGGHQRDAHQRLTSEARFKDLIIVIMIIVSVRILIAVRVIVILIICNKNNNKNNSHRNNSSKNNVLILKRRQSLSLETSGKQLSQASGLGFKRPSTKGFRQTSRRLISDANCKIISGGLRGLCGKVGQAHAKFSRFPGTHGFSWFWGLWIREIGRGFQELLASWEATMTNLLHF